MIKERNYGIDFFRILSSIMVVFLHTVGQGGILGAAGNLTIKGEVLYFIQIMCFCAVNSFALISGYVGIKTKHKYTSIISLWIQVAFYNVGVSAIKMAINLMNDKPIDLIMLLKSFFPVISEQNWYFTSYFCLFFFMPVLNHIVNTLSREKLRQNIFITIILFSIIETLFKYQSVVFLPINKIDTTLPLHFYKSKLSGASKHAFVATPGFQQKSVLAKATVILHEGSQSLCANTLAPIFHLADFNSQYANRVVLHRILALVNSIPRCTFTVFIPIRRGH